jgi:glycosyltransferase involved in cell wall biosynthesis
MRILLVVHGWPPEEPSGTELYAAGLARALAAQGHDVAVFAGSHTATAPLHELRDEEGVEVERFARPRARVRLRYDDAETADAFLAALDRFRPDVVHVMHLLGLTMPLVQLVRARGIRVVVTAWDHWFLCPEVQPYRPSSHPLHGERWGLNCFVHAELARPKRLASMLLEGSLLERARTHAERARVVRAELAAADLLIAPSHYLAGRLAQLGAQPTVLDHPVGAIGAAGRGPRERAVEVGFLGPLVPGKGADLVVRAFRGVRARSAGLVLRGPAPLPRYAARLRRLADARTRFGPPVAHGEVASFFAGIDLLVVPSRLHETFSFVVREAFASGVPVLAADVGALAEAVTPGANGDLFRAGSARDLRAKLRPLLEQPGALAELRSFPPLQTLDAHASSLAALYPRASEARTTARSVAS